MEPQKWTSALFYILLHAGNIFAVNGEENVPKWSDQVETQIRLVPSWAPQVIEMKLYFDKRKNALALVMGDYSSETKQENEDTIYIYDFNRSMEMSITGHNCIIPEISPLGNNTVQSNVDSNGNKKLKDFGSLFLFKPGDFATQVPFNQNDAVGFNVTKWESINVPVHLASFGFCNITHYIIGPENDNVETIYNRFAKIEGSCTLEPENIETKGVIVSLFADFMGSKNLISDDEIFQLPPGVYCEHMNSTTKDFPVLPPFFSFDFETFDSDNELSEHIPTMNIHKRIWYDGPHKLLRRDNLNSNFDIGITMISDYNSRLSYTVSDISHCDIYELTSKNTMEKDVALPGENFPWFPDSSSKPPVYIGQRKRYGITFDVWVNRNTLSQSIEVSDYYFINDLFSEENKTTPAPSFIEVFLIRQDKLVGSALQIINKFRMKPSLQDQSVFDVTRCFPENNKTRFSLEFTEKGGDDFGEINQQTFKNDVREKLLSSTKISTMRLGAVEIVFINESVAVVSSVIVESPSVLGYKQAPKETSKDEAMKSLTELVDDNKFVISVQSLEAKNINLAATKLTYPYVQEPSTNNNTNKDDKDKDTDKHKKSTGGFSSTTLAGVGIAMLALGAFQGVILLVAYIRYRKNDPLVRKLTSSQESPAQTP